ncbi:hypothetical protein E2F47_25020 [Mycobacterium eburneum]|nr:hypothetical protein [Mycobacterium eburneum]TDH48129.1 hypothetical protein E2F47_25020 [Mycobacterium eburneum]
MTAPAMYLLWSWFATRPRRQRWFLHAVWMTHLIGVSLFLFAPAAGASGVDSLLGFTGVHDSHGVALVSNRYVMVDDSLLSWNGVLPRINADVAGGISSGIGNAIGRFETSLIVVSASFMLWVMRALRSAFWNELFGALFSAIGLSIDKVLNSAPFLGLGILAGTFAGVMMMTFGRATGGRLVIGWTWMVGVFGLSFGRNLLGEMIAPSGWIDKIRTVSSGIAATMMSQGHQLRASSTAVDAKFDEMQVGFADAIRQALQQWMLGRVVDGPAPPDGVKPVPRSLHTCSQAWDAGQSSGNQKALAKSLVDFCPADVVAHIGEASLWEGLFLWALLLGCLGVGAWFAWCGLTCAYRAMFYGGFAPAFIVYGLFPTFPRRFLKLASADFVTQLLSYGVYMVLTGVYVLVLMVTWNLPAQRLARWAGNSVMIKLVVTAVMMVLFVGMVRHIAKLHRAAIGIPEHPRVTPATIAAPVTAAAGAGAAAGLSAASAARGGSGALGGRPVSNRSTSSRINAGLAAGQMALSRLHPASAAVGGLAGGMGSAGVSVMKQRTKSSKESAGGTGGRDGRNGSRAPAGPAGRSPANAPTATQRAQQRAQAVRTEAAGIARDSALKRPASSRPAAGNSSGFTP